MYGFNTLKQRKGLWDTLAEIAQTITRPWLISGDFNSMLYTQDRNFGNQITQAEIKDFTECILSLNLTELSWSGNYYTWINNR